MKKSHRLTHYTVFSPHTKGAWSLVTYENHLQVYEGTALQEMVPVVAAFVHQTPAWIPWSLLRAEPHPKVSSLSVQTTFPTLLSPLFSTGTSFHTT